LGVLMAALRAELGVDVDRALHLDPGHSLRRRVVLSLLISTSEANRRALRTWSGSAQGSDAEIRGDCIASV